MATDKEEIIYEIDIDAKDANSSLDKLKGDLDEVPGKAGGAAKSLKGVGQAMTAIATNPIGLILTAIAAIFTTLSAAAKRNEKAMENINKIMAVFKGTIDGLLNALGPLVEFLTDKLVKAFEDPMQTIKDLGKAIKENVINRFKALGVLGKSISALFRGEFKEAAKLAGDGMIQLTLGIEDGIDKLGQAVDGIKGFVKSVGEEVEKAIDMNKRLANSELALLRIQKDFELAQLTFQQLAEEQRQIRDDESKSMEERIAANIQLGVVLDEQLQTELNLAERQQNFARLKRAADGVTLENEADLLDARNKIAEINERIHAQRSEQLVNENALIKEQSEIELKAIEDEEAAELAMIEEVDRANKEQAAEDEKLQIQIEKNKDKRRKKEAKAEKELADIKGNLVAQGFAIIGGLADEESAIGKGVAIAEIGVDTVKGAQKALASSPPPSPLGAIGAGLVIASGLIAATKAAGVKFPKRKGSSGSSGVAATVPSIPVPSFTEELTDDISTDSAAAAINQQSRQPLEAFIVFDKLQAAENLNDNINANSSL